MRPFLIETEDVVEVEPAAAFDFVVNPANMVLFEGYGPVPGIERVEYLQGSPFETGSTLRVHNKDGSTHLEEVVETRRPGHFHLRMSGFQAPTKFLFGGMEEHFHFEQDGNCTRIRRRFEITARSLWIWPMALFVARVLMGAAVRRSSAAIVRALAG